MAHATFNQGGKSSVGSQIETIMRPTVIPKTTQMHTKNPKDSPGRGALDGGHKMQNCETVRSVLRKVPGRGKRF